MLTDEFPWVEAVTAPTVEHGDHIDNIQIAQLMYGAWRNYFVLGLGQDESELFSGSGRPIVREITARFDAEVFPDQSLKCGVRALSRSNRSFMLEQMLWRPEDEQVVARGTTAFVTIDVSTGRTVEVPPELWEAVEKAEGRSIPIVSR